MNSPQVSPEQALAWVRWWVQGARRAESGWVLGEQGIEPRRLAFLRSHSGPWLDAHLGMSNEWPPSPNPVLLPLLSLDCTQWLRVLNLVVVVCAGSQSAEVGGLSRAELVWCRRLGKALQPGHWLPPSWSADSPEIRGLRLLRAWVGEAVWRRLRLIFDRSRVAAAEAHCFAPLPPQRLTSLWQAVGWYALTFQNEQGTPHVDPPQPDPQ
ncbi:hypothetical protein K5E40_04545 [Pseudomonas baetica]|uniref:hypothetical protein n=1 Tax=Pseudomonas TaxID=286 RepID=UPI001C8BF7DC|nr:hypothetical protein [Pseudomonas baetica]MBX9404943.1 hypothetical protein [Pseudomonas baetica]